MSGIRTEAHGDVLELVFDRAEKKNAITDAMYGALADGIAAADADPALRVVLIRSEGDIFTAGNDLGDFAKADASAPKSDLPRNVTRFLRTIAAAEKPIVAAVQGAAVGVGTTMLLHCDYVVMAEGASLITPFVNLALVPEAASSLLLPARVGHPRAFAMFALGEPVPAKAALDWGLANQVVPLEEVTPAARAVAAKLAEKPLGALIATKKLMRDPAAALARMEVEGEVFARRLVSAEAKEAFAAFAERRKPDFRKFG
ncbi:MAG: enoyl-CoA hydratase-related protein [Pseudomonadota bacterium]|nr:enoyl-CoA hydratase-related protein [Pseudomonadota bacterium]MEE3099092.1 enoyl-CoA hydratase-related protein [Pseudomonadota bacterium]